MTPLESELGWAAGILDGEGGIYITRHNKQKTFGVRLMVGNTSFVLLQRFMEIVGNVGIIRHRPAVTAARKPVFVYDATSANAAHVARLLAPYLVLKRAQCDLLLEAVTLIGKPGTQRNPHRPRLEVLYGECRRLTRVGAVPERCGGQGTISEQLSINEAAFRAL